MEEENRENLLLMLSAGLSQADVQPMTGLPGMGMLAAAGSLLGLNKPSQRKTHAGCVEDDTCPSPGSKARKSTTQAAAGSSVDDPACSRPHHNSLELGANSGSARRQEVSGAREHEGQGWGIDRALPRRVSMERAPPECAGYNGNRVLRENSTVCFTTQAGELLKVVQNGKIWELQPCADQDMGQGGEGGRFQYYGVQSLFLVKRRDKYVIFQALGAEGRSLQAVSGQAPHRCSNYNLGPWESWEPTPHGLMNAKWPTKKLGYEIHEVSCVAAEDLRKVERNQMKTAKLVRSAEERVQVVERELEMASRTNQRQNNKHQREIEELRNRLEEAQQEKQRQEVECLHASAMQKQLELRIAELTKDKDAADSLYQTAQAEAETLRRDLMSTQDRHMNEVKKVKQSFEGEVRSLRRERDLDLQRTKDFTEKQKKQVHEEIQQREHQRNLLVKQLTTEHKNAVKVKDAEIRQLVKEHYRLLSILKKVKSKMEDAHQARQTYEAAQAAPPGWNTWHRQVSHGFLPLHGASSGVPTDFAMLSSGGSQMEYSHRASPGASMSGMQMDMINEFPHRPFSPNYRIARTSPPASAMSGEWMELNASKTIVEEWMQKGQGDADRLYEKQMSSDESASGVSGPSPVNVSTKPIRDASVEPALEVLDEKVEDVEKSTSPLLASKAAFGSATPDRHGESDGKWEAVEQLKVNTPPLEDEESKTPDSLEAAMGHEEHVFSSPDMVVVP